MAQGESVSYPAFHFPGTPLRVRLALRRALSRAGIPKHKHGEWRAALEAMARYETNCTTPTSGSSVCPGCRGMLQCAVGMYSNAKRQGYISRVSYASRTQAFEVAIHYIDSELFGYGGYGGIENLLARTDRGPGEVLRYWQDHPDATFEAMRQFYNGY